MITALLIFFALVLEYIYDPISQMKDTKVINVTFERYKTFIKGYLDNKGFNSIFTIMYDPSEDLKIIDKTINELDDIPYLLEFATEQRLLEGGVTGGHPVPDGYLRWTKEHLIPYLIDNSVHPTP